MLNHDKKRNASQKPEGNNFWNEKPRKKSQKDIDARLTVKGYENKMLIYIYIDR